ncbi:stage V sporulation protein D (sporulation-specific penicillin-binding protein) [Clostridium cavendishii DSM 21758]|uniref:Stage V sporulation protein D (Sporulation-specific penicillin-binding protein) n=1 Tax=Clostridium cavendishii DSM 21758 TaxID=1121302 RepID=A0A1M6KPZ9_9CLOT|nr:stage V sporulation protein D [Clostridium cavendishii]SHJ61017.1 stage V sporulation protein D (sporulation-specific penicillin-binding protein) [Clostridium cavendishii DSM 21758]
MKERIYRDKSTIKRRMYIVICCLIITLFILTLRLSYIMIFKSTEYAKMAADQWTSEVKIDARRGRILDRNNKELAVSANVYRIDFDLNAIRSYCQKNNTNTDEIANKISKAVGIDKPEVLKKLEFKLPSGANAGAATLVRRIEKEDADKVKELKINGVLISPDTKRYYPNNNFLAQVLGTTNSDGKGLGGVEYVYDKALSGTPGLRLTEIDRRSEELPYTISRFTRPVDGKDVTLTVDEKIQGFAEKAAEIALNDNKAKAVSVIVMNPKTGEVLAMANKPDFNPNKPYEGAENFEGSTAKDKIQKMWRNRCVSDTFEPGSIFKVITSIGAMEEGIGGGSEKYNCGGSIKVLNRTIKCWKRTGHGTQPFPDIIKNSCNVGFVELGKAMGKEKLNAYIKKFGLGKVSGVDLPGEAKGIVKKTENITDVDLATIAFGQTNTVNPVQFMTAFNAIANGGTLIQPHVMKDISHADDNGKRILDYAFNPKTERVVSEEKTRLLRTYLERVVTEGSAKRTFIDGYHIAGKTGTAQKVINGVYAPGKYISSFMGMAPCDDPKVTVMVSIDEPSNGEYYAGLVTTPAAKILFTDIFNYLDPDSVKDEVNKSLGNDVLIPEVRGKNVNEVKKILKDLKLNFEIQGEGEYINDITPKPGCTVKEGAKINLYTGATATYNKEVVVPDVIGYTKEGAIKIFNKLGIKASFEGEGLIEEMSSEPNEVISKDTEVKCKLDTDLDD